MQVAVLTILPGLLYLSLFSLHFSLLTKVGVILVTLIVTFLALFHIMIVMLTLTPTTLRLEPTTPS